ncbi:threonine synthase [Terfezia boudieri ATCC MYA-4762]|uniref:threonine synthase n=1 Tax=Terfezia boudieri ATCC MYA-4762 TaxID=1051890 RepID=A0A3N4L7J4_9PEZI|nr:threonine synthase [Terfezia boudieri ATCC MYA-4762]
MADTHSPAQRYLSTRGGSYGLSFEDVVLKGLATDGGLFIPESIPYLPSDWFTAWSKLTFQQLAYEILSLYISPAEIPPADLRNLVERSYSTFRHPEVTPTVPLSKHQSPSEPQKYLLELFHGPTFAFKDVALQFVGNLFEYFLQRKNEGKAGAERHHLTVVGATSGDTGSAAIYGLRGKKDVSVFILHPHKRVSAIQEAQMTTVLDRNVHNVAVEGTFDDCQDTVKSLFSDPEFNKLHNLGAVNSINWARILAQITYYFYSYFSLARKLNLTSPDPSVLVPIYVVPTGNFGDILAGYYAKRMGLPIRSLWIATNANDILYRFFDSGVYEKQTTAAANIKDGVKADASGVKETLSPAMDILVSSNFERLLWYLALEAESDGTPAGAGDTVAKWMSEFKSTGRLAPQAPVREAFRKTFSSRRVGDDEILATIKSTYEKYDYILDPHTAVGVSVMNAIIPPKEEVAGGEVWITLSTAHPAKFSGAVDLALEGVNGYSFEEKVRPREFVGLEERERRCRVVGVVDAEVVKGVIEEELRGERE